MNSLERLTRLIMSGLPDKGNRSKLNDETKAAVDAIFGDRYHSRSKYSKRSVLLTQDDKISFAGLVHHDSPDSGVYGGMSLIWFPIEADDDGNASSLLTFVCGTRGLSPDEHILGRPGHVRHLRALQRHLIKNTGVPAWIKQDPTDLIEAVPKLVQRGLARFEEVFKRYGSHIYACVEVPDDFEKASKIVSGFFDMYAWERDWLPLKKHVAEIEEFKLQLRSCLFPKTSMNEVIRLLEQRRFVILQGPPGTGKTRMATEIRAHHYGGNGFTVQFHPAVTYESFVSGISPRVDGKDLNFEVKQGWLLNAIAHCNGQQFLLHLDEINRADLSRVLGEAIYLFEPREISKGISREVQLQHAIDVDGKNFGLSIPKNLHVLGTMNSADRSIAIMDMAVRRRFAFVDIWPDIDVVKEQKIDLATESFSQLQDIFSQYATDEAFNLLPGHSYFLADTEAELRDRLKFELLTLLREYLLEGRLTSCESELRAYIDSIAVMESN